MGKTSSEKIKMHYFQRYVCAINLRNFWCALLIALYVFAVFLLFSLEDLHEVLNSLLLFIQVNASITIFLGILFGCIAFRDLPKNLQNLKFALRQNNRIFHKIEDAFNTRLTKSKAHLVGLAFSIAAFYIVFGSSGDHHYSIFPGGFTPVYVYVVIFEICLFMANLLGATGYWLLFSLSKLFSSVGKLAELHYELIDIDLLKTVISYYRKLSFFLLIIILSFLPSVVIIGLRLESLWYQVATFLFGVVAPTILWVIAFFVPNRSLYPVVNHSLEVQENQLRVNILEFENRIKKLRDSRLPGERKYYIDLASLYFFRRELDLRTKFRSFPAHSWELFQFVGTVLLGPAFYILLTTIQSK